MENNKKILAASLLEWTLGSKTTFAKDENKDLADKAKKLGIELPSPDLAAFETIYCEVDKYNLNGVKVSKKAAEKGIATLIGKQINWNHSGAHQICGYIIDAFIKEGKIYIDGILFKSLFTSEFGEVIQLFEEGKLFVSFELWNRKEDGTSIVKDCGNGYRELTEFVAHGCALLLLDPETGKPIPPACPKAQVLKLLATSKVIEEANGIVEKIFENDERLVYAELSTEEDWIKCKDGVCKEEANVQCECLKCGKVMSSDKHCKDIKCPECGGDMRRKDRPGPGQPTEKSEIKEEGGKDNIMAEEVKIEEVKKEEVIVEEPIKAEEKVEEVKVEEKPAEIKAEEIKAEESQVTPEPAQVADPAPEVEQKPAEQAQVVVEQPAEPSRKLAKIVTYDGTETTTLFAETGETTLKKRRVTTIRYFTDGTDERSEHEEEAIETFTYSQLEEKVNAAKAEKDAEIATLKAEKEAKEIEVTNLKTELDSKNQEIAELKTPKVEVAKEEVKEEQPILEVGNTSTKTIDKYVERRKKINKKAYGHENNGM
jgi:DNA-directed RNA polymerase subunit RPC12/RpoP